MERQLRCLAFGVCRLVNSPRMRAGSIRPSSLSKNPKSQCMKLTSQIWSATSLMPTSARHHDSTVARAAIALANKNGSFRESSRSKIVFSRPRLSTVTRFESLNSLLDSLLNFLVIDPLPGFQRRDEITVTGSRDFVEQQQNHSAITIF